MSDPNFLSALKNAVTALSTIAQTGVNLSGNTTSPAYSTSVILSTQAGWVANAQVIVAGSTPGYIYNCQNFASATTANKLMTLQNTIGQQKAGCNFNNGLVLAPGTGQLVSITYSLATPQTQT